MNPAQIKSFLETKYFQNIYLEAQVWSSQNSVHQKMKNKDKDRNIQELKRNRQRERKEQLGSKTESLVLFHSVL